MHEPDLTTAPAVASTTVLATASGFSETLKIIAIFCGAGLAVSMLLASYGIDLSAGFF